MSPVLTITIAAIIAATGVQAARPPITIEGVFVSANGRGIPNGRIELRQRHWGFPLEPVETPVATTKTDKNGRFRFAGPWRGRFRLWCFSSDETKMATREVHGSERDIRIFAH